MVTFDTEDNGQGDIFLINFYNGKTHKTFETKDFKNLETFRKRIIEYIFSTPDNIFIAHNLEYDLSHIFQGIYLTLVDWYYTEKLIYCKVPFSNKKFLDSFNYSFTSLQEIGKQISHYKLGIDIENIYEEYLNNPDKVIRYCQRDSEIVYKYMDLFFHNLKMEFNIKPKNTLAGTAQKIYLKNFCKHQLTGINTNAELLKTYYGGRVECFYIGDIARPVFEIDVNSMYPYVMKKFKYPIARFSTSNYPDSKTYAAKIKVKVKPCPVPVLPYRSGKLLFPAGTFETYATNIEIEKAIKENQIEDIEYLKVFNFHSTDYIFKDFINYFYTKREKAKKYGNDFESQFYKLIMNSVYGRFALHKGLKILTGLTNKNEDKINLINDFSGYVEIKNEKKSSVNFAISLFVTSYARLILYDLIKKVASLGFDVLYCDTDSVYFTKFKYEELFYMIEKIFDNFKIDNKLGNYSLACYETAHFSNVKAYFLETYFETEKIKLKGVRKDKRKEFFETGRASYKKPVKLRSALRSIKGLKVNSWENFIIERRGEFDKRQTFKIDDHLYYTEPIII